jgi:ornithine cyclodeaminase/alanine dehydrogenase-like protein (mu-crystallin family)
VHHVLGLRRAFAWDIDPAIAQAFARQMSAELGIEVGTTANVRDATLASDVIATCTTSRQAVGGFADWLPREIWLGRCSRQCSRVSG